MIWIAALVEIIIKNYPDMAILVAINLANASLSFYETTKAGDAIAALKASLKPTAICFRDGKWNNLFDARLLVPGDLIELASGAAVPADCMLNHGTIDTDESAMTGESLPVTLHEREMAKMGGTVARGETHATVVLTGKNTFFGKTASMLTSTTGRSNLQWLLLKIIIILCILAFCLVLTAFIYLLVRGVSVEDSASFAVVVIVASIPMAIEIVTTTTLAIGSKQLSLHGAIVSRLAAIDDLAGLNMLCSDKTGTLTKNKMTIQDDAPAYEPNTTQMDLLKQSALAARWESPPKDALDTLFLRCHLWYPGVKEALAEYAAAHPNITQIEKDEWYNHEIHTRLQVALSDYQSLAFLPFDPKTKRTESTVRIKSTGSIIKVTKGAPHVIHALDKDEAKGEAMMAKVAELGEDGIRAVTIAVSDPINDQWVEGSEEQHITPIWHITGMLTFLDPPREDTKETMLDHRAMEYQFV
jgi:H+-transporting ATPase